MAFCSNCGAAVPEGAAFCPNCGASRANAPKPQPIPPEADDLPAQNPAPIPSQPEPVTDSAPIPSDETAEVPPPFLSGEAEVAPPPIPPQETPFRPQQELPPVTIQTEPVEKKKSKLPLILGAVVLLAAVVLGVLFLTGVLGGKSDPGLEGVWVLADSGKTGLSPGDIILDIAADGTGTAKILGSPTALSWTKDSITINGITDPMRLDGEALIIEEDGGSYVFRRDSAEEASAPGGGAFSSAFGPVGETRPEEAAPAENTPAENSPAAEAPEPTPEPTPEPIDEPTINESGDGPYWNLPAFTYSTGKSFPFGQWGGVYVYNGWFFKTYFQLNEDYTCSRKIYRDGEVVADETGVFEYENNKIKLYMNGDRNTWTEYVVSGEMMVNNNHEFFRQDPGGLIGAWVGDYYYNNKHIHTTYILRTDGTYSEVTFRDEEKITDNEGTWTFDGSTLKLKATDTPNLTTPFTYVDDVLINNNYKYWRS